MLRDRPMNLKSKRERSSRNEKSFGEEIIKLAKTDDKIVLISGDVEHEMDEFKKQFPDRYINIGL